MHRHTLRLVWGTLLLSAAGCVASPLDHEGAWSHRPAAGDAHALAQPVRVDAPEPTGELSLRDAVAAALRGSPSLAGFSYAVRAAEARAVQAGRLPNPTFEVEAENVLSDGDASETTALLSQLFQLGGDRRARVRAARAERDLAAWDYEAQRVGVVAEVASRYYRLLAVQGRLELARETEAVADGLYQSVTRQIDAGQVAGVERNRADVARARVRLQTGRLERELSAARHRLAAMWGSVEPRFDRAGGTLDDLGELPQRARLLQAVVDSPDIARFAAEVARGRARVDVARAAGVPDLTLAAGAKHAHESDDVGLVVGLGLELPLFDRNRGEVRAARAELARTLTQQRAAEGVAGTAVAAAYEELAAAHEAAVALRDELIPAAQRTYGAVQEAFGQGQVSFLDVLDAQRTLIELRQERLDTLAAYRGAAANAQGLIARPLSSLGGAATDPGVDIGTGADEAIEPALGLPGAADPVSP